MKTTRRKHSAAFKVQVAIEGECFFRNHAILIAVYTWVPVKVSVFNIPQPKDQ